MGRLFISTAALLFAGALWTRKGPLWIHHRAISPGGTTIAFAYKGDTFTVPMSGGKATQITTNPTFDTTPAWNPDSKQIAFASGRMGSLGVFIVSKEGDEPCRLTTFSDSGTPVAFSGVGQLLFTAGIMPSAENADFPPNGQFQQIYQIPVTGEHPVMLLSMPMGCISISEEGTILYQDKKGYEDYQRRHQKSPIACDIWMLQPRQTLHYEEQTTFISEGREPVWALDGKSFYHLSEENGSFSIYQRIPGSNISKRVAHRTQHPVRFPSMVSNGNLCYGFDGEIYTLTPNGKSQKVSVRILLDRNDKDLIRQIKTSEATEMVVSPNDKEVTFILREDVYMTSVEYKTTKQITNTPYQEHGVDFALDGRSLMYALEHGELWQLYTSSIVRRDEEQFTYATELREERLTNSDITSFNPKYSPDRKEVAFLGNRTAIRVINLKTEKVCTVVDAQYQYSYNDDDRWFEWSPDSKWILSEFIGIGGWDNKDIVLLGADDEGEMHSLTENGYSDGGTKQVLGGKAMVWFSGRAGRRSHGSWGTQYDAYIMFFSVDTYDRSHMNKGGLALLEGAEKAEKAEEKRAEKKKKEDKKGDKKRDVRDKKDREEEKKEEVKPPKFGLDNQFDRTMRLTVDSSFMGDVVLTPEGDKLYYLAAFESGYDLWEHSLKGNSTKILLKGVKGGSLLPDKRSKNIFMCTGGGMKRIKVAGSETTLIAFESFFDYQPGGERVYIFDHVWQQADDKFYMEDLQGVDWPLYKKTYRKFLPRINNNYDFAELLSEMLRELNISHTGARYSGIGGALPTASLGVFYGGAYTGDGLKIKEVIEQSPFTLKKTDVRPGCIIERVDGSPIEEGGDYFPLFEGKVRRKVLLSIYDPATKKHFEETVKAISYGARCELLYKRWIECNRKKVGELLDGRSGYVHIKGMDSQNFRRMYSELLERYRNKETVVVDVRHNGGGWLYDDVVTLLDGREYQRLVPHGQYIDSDPFGKWLEPSCMPVCEDNYSSAHGTPYVYKTLGVGRLVDTPVAGTMTAVWWERQIDPSLVFGIPQVGCMDMQGNYLENQTLEPDVLIYSEPSASLKEEDAQLKAAVDYLLKELPKK